MRKIEIVTRIAEETGLTKVKAEEAVDAILEEIKDSLQRGEPVTLRRFGSFQVREKRARPGRNPKRVKKLESPRVGSCALNRGKILRSRSTRRRTLKDDPMGASAH